MKKKLFITIALCVLSTASYSQLSKDKTINSCKKKTKSQIDYSICLDEVKLSKDRELTTWVNNQVFILDEVAKSTGRTSTLKIFKRSQTHFEKYREDNCRWQFIAYGQDNKAIPVYKECYIKLTKQRIDELASLNK